MIINIIFELFKLILMGVFGILPDLPDMPAGIVSVLDTAQDFLVYGFRFVAYVLTPTFMLVILPVILIMINFKWIYHLVMWIVRKLPLGAQ